MSQRKPDFPVFPVTFPFVFDTETLIRLFHPIGGTV